MFKLRYGTLATPYDQDACTAMLAERVMLEVTAARSEVGGEL